MGLERVFILCHTSEDGVHGSEVGAYGHHYHRKCESKQLQDDFST